MMTIFNLPSICWLWRFVYTIRSKKLCKTTRENWLFKKNNKDNWNLILAEYQIRLQFQHFTLLLSC